MATAATQKDRAPSLRPINHMRLGELLVDDGKITEHDVKRVLAGQVEQGQRFGEVALRMGLVNERDVRRALARQFRFPYAIPGESPLNPALVAAYQPFGQRTETLRGLRSELMLRWFGRGNTTLAIMGVRRGQGCSVLAANLAIAFAQLGERTLLIDANLRNPRQQTLFGLSAPTTLVDFLKGRDCLDEALTEVPGFNQLTVLCAGAPPPNPQELLGRVAFSYLMETMPASYGIIIVDTPPLLEYADAQVIATRVHGGLLTVKRHETRMVDIERAQSQLDPTGAVLLGAVIDE